MLLQHEEFVTVSPRFCFAAWAKKTLDLGLAFTALGAALYLVKIISDLATVQ